MEKLLKISEVAKIFNITTQSIYLWIHSGKIKPIRINDGYRIPESEVSRILGNTEAN